MMPLRLWRILMLRFARMFCFSICLTVVPTLALAQINFTQTIFRLAIVVSTVLSPEILIMTEFLI